MEKDKQWMGFGGCLMDGVEKFFAAEFELEENVVIRV